MQKTLRDASSLARLLGLYGLSRCEDAQEKVGKTLLVAPSLLEYEIGNILKKYPEKNANNILCTFQDFGIEYFCIQNPIRVFELAQKHKLSYYNASYLELFFLDRSIGTFLTCDTDFSNIDDRILICEL